MWEKSFSLKKKYSTSDLETNNNKGESIIRNKEYSAKC